MTIPLSGEDAALFQAFRSQFQFQELPESAVGQMLVRLALREWNNQNPTLPNLDVTATVPKKKTRS